MLKWHGMVTHAKLLRQGLEEVATKDEHYRADVVRWIREFVGHHDADFGDLIRALPGVDPIVVRMHLDDAASGLSSSIRWTRYDSVVSKDDPLPVPHPLDFDWRFTNATLRSLSDELLEAGSRRTILGAPSLWLSLRDRKPSTSPCLFDANPLIVRSVSDIKAQEVSITNLLADPFEVVTSDIVFADPPWYPEHLKAFSWVGSSLLDARGVLYLSVPPVGTRPGVERERAELLSWTNKLGLTPRCIRSGALGYAMPPFERAALSAAGILPFVPHDWRRGDLIVFERTGDIQVSRPQVHDKPWSERTIDGIRIKIDVSAPAPGTEPNLVSVIDGDVLPSISRRDDRRGAVHVWTSGNRVFGCAAPNRLLEIIDTLIGGALPTSPSDRSAAMSIKVLVEQEKRDLAV